MKRDVKTTAPATGTGISAVDPQQAATQGIKGLCDIFREGLRYPESQKRQIQNNLDQGKDYFEKWNTSRMRLAFESFDSSMKLALFEIIYLLHVNDPKLKNWRYARYQTSSGQEVESGLKEVNLHVEGAPFGVKGIQNLSSVFKDEFTDYIQGTFGASVVPSDYHSEPPIEGIYSIGSIGTVGHKNIDSDLDLQVQYNLEPSLLDSSQWTDKQLLEALQTEHRGLIQQYFKEKGVENPGSQPKAVIKKVYTILGRKLKERYPLLYQHFYPGKMDLRRELQKPDVQKLRAQLIFEITDLMKKSAGVCDPFETGKKEKRLKARIEMIQGYVTDKFPEAEIYLFSFSRQRLQKGYFGSTVESKESSGGAYELILNYETLLPGIYFTPVIPSHFLFSAEVNNSTRQFDRFHDLIRAGLLEGFDKVAGNLIFQGPTPDLDPLYVAEHSSAAYWEAFKGSSGNLPKATLNLLRFEMLLEKKVNKTNIQMVKHPEALDDYVLEPELESGLDRIPGQIYPVAEFLFFSRLGRAGDDGQPGVNFDVKDLIIFEEKYPQLKYDPWWLRYKTLKIGYGSPGIISIVPDGEIARISNIIDLAFALHVRVSDVFSKPGESKKSRSHRETVLSDYLMTVFPEGSEQRNRLHATIIGDVQTVNEFETALREVFQNSVERIHEKVSRMAVAGDEKTSDEFQIWYHYYKQSFKPPPNVIQKSILNHLQVPRGRLQIGFDKDKQWFFRSLQKGKTVGKRFESSILNLLPEKITLVKGPFFLNGLVHCVINGYYGIFNRGQLHETKTVVEYDRSHTDLGSKLDNSLAFVRPDQIERIMKSILELFPDRTVSYLDCIAKERVINEVMVFLNLLKYGQLSILYRDNLNTYYIDHVDLPHFQDHVDTFVSSYPEMLTARSLQIGLQTFFSDKQINPMQVKLVTWVNSNSVETAHSVTQYETKEAYLAEKFKELVQQVPV